jgi:hypothetical protein
MRSRRRKFTKAELRAMGATPGFMSHRIGWDGRARLEQLAPEDSRGTSLFLGPGSNRRLHTDEEGS